MPDTDYAQLWDNYTASKSIELRNAIALKHRGLARRLATRASIDALSEQRADLEQIAFLGLIKAVERFDPASCDTRKGTLYALFGAFAGVYCRGEILHFLRDKSAIKIPRGWRDFYSQVRKARKHGAVTNEQVAAVTGSTPEQIDKIDRAYACLHPVKLDFHDHELEIEFESPFRTEYEEDGDSLSGCWAEVVSRLQELPAMERKAIVGVFVEQKPRARLARQLMVDSFQVDMVLSSGFKGLLGLNTDLYPVQLGLFTSLEATPDHPQAS